METPIQIITGTALSNKCDYSFGDHLGGANSKSLTDGFMKPANESNIEFIEKCKEFEGKLMTLFIDNIRLYQRSLMVDEIDVPWVTYLMTTNNLLWLCKQLPKNKFLIFTSHEDTPIDKHIEIPDNVIGIHAVNAEYFNEKIHPFPYGLQREIQRGDDYDNRVNILKEELDREVKPTKLLYINCGISRNKEREYLTNFEGLPWITTRFDKDSKFFPYSKYREFLNEMRDHKFMLCPQGHGMDCHRNWESLYMRRVPVMLEHPYFRKLMQGFPVLFVKEWSQITHRLLEDSDYLYEEAQHMSLKKLDLDLIFRTIVLSYETNNK